MKAFFQNQRGEIFNSLDSVALIQLVLKGAIVGIFAGFVGSIFRYMIHLGNDFRVGFVADASLTMLIIWAIVMIIAGWICHVLLKWAPLSGGSGIPQIEGEMKGIFDMNPYRTLISKFIGGGLTGVVGFSVGREGPSVQLGGSAGKMIAHLFKSSLRETRILTSAGAAAGLTAAFSAPISGAIFVFEEVHKSFYPKLIIPTFTATIMANFVTTLIFGLEPSLGFTVSSSMDLIYFPNLIILGIVVGLLGVIFNRSILGIKALYDRWSISRGWKIGLTFLAVTLIGYDSQLLLGGGNELAKALSSQHETIGLLAGIVVGKVLLTAICYGNGAQGGIFLPMVVIGSAMGALVQHILVEFHYIPDMYLGIFVICGMSGMLAATMRTPLLAILLVLEMTNSFHSIYQVGTVAIVAYLTAEFCKEPPIYDALLERMSSSIHPLEEEQTFFETRVGVTCPYIDKPLRELPLPEGAMVVSIVRGGQHIVPLPNTTLVSGDDLYISCQKGDLKAAKDCFSPD